MEPTPTASKYDWPLIALFALLALAAVGALYDAFSKQEARQHVLQAELLKLQQQLTSTDARAHAGADAGQLAEAQAAIADLTARLAMVEKTTQAPPAVIQNPLAGAALAQLTTLEDTIAQGKPYADALAPLAGLPLLAPVIDQLNAHAAQGVASEETLRQQLADLLQPGAQDDAALSKLNERLKGIMRIHRLAAPGSDPYSTLRQELDAHAALDLLITSAQSLDDSARAPLTAWLDAATTRQSLLAALHAALTPPAPKA